MTELYNICNQILFTIRTWCIGIVEALNTNCGELIEDYFGEFIGGALDFVIPSALTDVPLYAVLFGGAMFIFVICSGVSILKSVIK